MDLLVVEQVMVVLKLLLACMSIIFLFAFFMQWKFLRLKLPSIAFYTKGKFVKHNVALGTGIVCLSLAYIVDFIAITNNVETDSMKLTVYSLEVIALAFIGYSYYKLIRFEIPE